MKRLKENGHILVYDELPKSDESALLIEDLEQHAIIELDYEEVVNLQRVIAGVLHKELPANPDGYALAKRTLEMGPFFFYHIGCSVHNPFVSAHNVGLDELPTDATCAKCGGNIHKAALLDE